ncbi:hypothetical protein CDAR_63331 [Caerostris darwini]|uniref:Uncharacterized protein n=1 Tax=Caerostris darwini TaxID=1538125 RepID=A0AAV4QLT9_9ARAC|nr:hypothetical protein CDAR_63331 [Caerostris darwini]
MKELWNRQAITTQSNALPLPGCFSTPPFISIPSTAFNRLPFQKNCFHLPPPPSVRPFQCSVTTPFATPASETGRRMKNIQKVEERRMTLEKEDLNSYVRWLQILLVRPSEKTR